MKVLHFYKTYYPETMGGVEQVIYQLAEECSALGVKSEVLTISPFCSVHDVQIGNHVAHRVKGDIELASMPISVRAIAEFSRLAKDADLIHYHFPWPYMDLVHFISRHKKPSVLSYHSDIVKQKKLLQFYRPLQHLFLSDVDSIVCASPNYANSSDTLKKFKSKVSIVPYGLSRELYPAVSDLVRSHWCARFPMPFFLFVGKLRYYKGIGILLAAAAESKLPVVIVGDGPLMKDTLQSVSNMGLDNVSVLGELSDEDKSALLELCFGFVFPSNIRSEAFGISLLEAAMFGRPLISCEIGTGTSYVNIADETGLVIPPSDSKALSNAMFYLYSNPELAAVMGAKARKRFEAVFTSRKMAEGYMKLYHNLVADKKV